MKFYANTELLNWKQVLKFQQNRSTSATATASLVRSLRSTIGRGVIDCQVCVRANGKTPAHLKSVFKMSTVCSNASSKMWMPLPDLFIDDNLLEMLSLFDQARLQLVDVTCLYRSGTHALAASPNLVVDWVKVRTVGWPESWSDVYCLSDYVICLHSLCQHNFTSGRLSA